MPPSLPWLHLQNEKRKQQRRDEGKPVRAKSDGEGRARAKRAWVHRRTQERVRARLRKMRRPYVQGRRRLWGKGPAPAYYINLRAGLAQKEPIPFEAVDSFAESPDSMLAQPGSCTSSSPLLQQGFESEEPIDDEALDLLDNFFDRPSCPAQVTGTEPTVRNLARLAGVCC